MILFCLDTSGPVAGAALILSFALAMIGLLASISGAKPEKSRRRS